MMHDAQAVLEASFPEMRWRCLSLAADLDRVERADGGATVLAGSRQIAALREALALLQLPGTDRAERVQMIFSDQTPPPP